MTDQDIQTFVNATLADLNVDLSVPLAISLAGREGLRTEALTSSSRGDYHPAVGDVPGSLTYRDRDRLQIVALSPGSELILSAYLER
ncbi:hypothetical protein OK074_5052 [Actinobacteria bacterium OK074]|nr:hypothetical protein OK074_5052 [Actinobacteria bacterium OK074]